MQQSFSGLVICVVAEAFLAALQMGLCSGVQALVNASAACLPSICFPAASNWLLFLALLIRPLPPPWPVDALLLSGPHPEAPQDSGHQQREQGSSGGQEPGCQSGLASGPQRIPGHCLHDEVHKPCPLSQMGDPPWVFNHADAVSVVSKGLGLCLSEGPLNPSCVPCVWASPG